jgi:hypothetical protein
MDPVRKVAKRKKVALKRIGFFDRDFFDRDRVALIDSVAAATARVNEGQLLHVLEMHRLNIQEAREARKEFWEMAKLAAPALLAWLGTRIDKQNAHDIAHNKAEQDLQEMKRRTAAAAAGIDERTPPPSGGGRRGKLKSVKTPSKEGASTTAKSFT